MFLLPSHFGDHVCPPVSSDCVSLDLFLSPHVWQPASWVTSSRDHLDVFRLGAGPEITLQGLRCHHHLEGSCKSSGSTGAERHSRVCASLRHTGASHRQGAWGMLSGHLSASSPSLSSNDVARTKLNFTKGIYIKQETTQRTEPYAFYSAPSIVRCMNPTVTWGCLRDGLWCDCNHLAI